MLISYFFHFDKFLIERQHAKDHLDWKTETWTNRQTDTEQNKNLDRHMKRWTNRERERQTDKYKRTDWQTDRQKDEHTDSQTNYLTQTNIERKTKIRLNIASASRNCNNYVLSLPCSPFTG